jgi:uncharacterized protein (DUF924 family)
MTMAAAGLEAIDRLPPPAVAVLEFWFGARAAATWGQDRPEWFRKDAAFDAQVRSRFGVLIDQALRGALAGWTAPWGDLAHILVLDQFSRNAHRGNACAYAGDTLALDVAQRLVASGGDRELPPTQRSFVYMPFEHAEDLAVQGESVRLFRELAAVHPAAVRSRDFAERHRTVIARFGRFPHRNAILGRVSTPEEVAFLQLPGSGF